MNIYKLNPVNQFLNLDQIKINQIKYDKYSFEKDPADKLFKTFFGDKWTTKFINNFLFTLNNEIIRWMLIQNTIFYRPDWKWHNFLKYLINNLNKYNCLEKIIPSKYSYKDSTYGSKKSKKNVNLFTLNKNHLD